MPTGSSCSPGQLAGQAELAEQQEQVHLGDAQLDVLARRPDSPAQRPPRRPRRRARPRRPNTPALLIQPPRLVDTLTSGEVVTIRSATPRSRARLEQHAAERLLRGRARAAAGRPSGATVSTGRAAGRRRPSQPGGGLGAQHAGPLGASLEARPTRRPGRSARSPAQLVDLLAGEQRGVVQRPPGDRQPVALDRVGEDDRRPVGAAVRARRAPRTESREVVPAEVADQRPDSATVRLERAPQLATARPATACARAPRSPSARPRRTATGTPGWASRRSAGAAGRRRRGRTPRAAGGRTSARPRAIRPPRTCARSSRGLDHRARRGRGVWRFRSTIQSGLAESARCRVEDRLPDVALVELGVAEQRDEAPAGVAAAEVRLDVAVGQRAEQRRRRSRGRPSRSSSRPGTDPSCGSGRPGARRSRAASSGSGASRRPSRYSIACSTGEACGLTETRSSALEIARTRARSSADHRRRRRLVAADLERVRRRPLAVRVVDDPHRQPQHAPLDLGEGGQLGVSGETGSGWDCGGHWSGRDRRTVGALPQALAAAYARAASTSSRNGARKRSSRCHSSSLCHCGARRRARCRRRARPPRSRRRRARAVAPARAPGRRSRTGGGRS